MPCSIDTKNVCFSDIIISHVAKSCRNEDALAAKFSTSEMGEFIGSFAGTFFSPLLRDWESIGLNIVGGVFSWFICVVWFTVSSCVINSVIHVCIACFCVLSVFT